MTCAITMYNFKMVPVLSHSPWLTTKVSNIHIPVYREVPSNHPFPCKRPPPSFLTYGAAPMHIVSAHPPECLQALSAHPWNAK